MLPAAQLPVPVQPSPPHCPYFGIVPIGTDTDVVDTFEVVVEVGFTALVTGTVLVGFVLVDFTVLVGGTLPPLLFILLADVQTRGGAFSWVMANLRQTIKDSSSIRPYKDLTNCIPTRG